MKKKNNIFVFIIVTLFGVILFTSCVDNLVVGDKFLDRAPDVATNEDSIFTKAIFARAYLWDVYDKMYTPFNSNTIYYLDDTPLDALSDCIQSQLSWGSVKEVWYPGTYSATYASGWIRDRMSFFKIWAPVRNCWNFIEKVDRVPDMTGDEKERLKAEAKILISQFYYILFRHVGGLPIIDHAYNATEPFVAPRATVEETVNFMVKLLDEAVATPALPFVIPDAEIATTAGRLTKAGALGFKAKVLLFAASPLFNSDAPYTTEAPQIAVEKKQVWYGAYKPELWQQCLDACKAFFDQDLAAGNPYILVQAVTQDETGYMAAYRAAYWNRGNSEKVIEVHGRTFADEWGDQFPINVAHQGSLDPTVEFMEMFPNADGSPFTGMSVYNTTNPTNIDIFEKRDPRLYETMLTPKKGRKWQNYAQIEVWQKGNIYTAASAPMIVTGLAPFKWCLDFRNLNVQPVQFSLLRMGEMHLIYAEALAETGNLSAACDQIDLVRARVGLGKIADLNPSLDLKNNKANLINEILRERACELSYEESRLFDICRRKLADKFTTPLHGIIIARKDGKGTLAVGELYPTQFTYNTFEFTGGNARAWWRPGFFTPKWYLQALPLTEINKDYGLTQNPGW